MGHNDAKARMMNFAEGNARLDKLLKAATGEGDFGHGPSSRSLDSVARAEVGRVSRIDRSQLPPVRSRSPTSFGGGESNGISGSSMVTLEAHGYHGRKTRRGARSFAPQHEPREPNLLTSRLPGAQWSEPAHFRHRAGLRRAGAQARKCG